MQTVAYTPEGAVTISYPTLLSSPLSLGSSIGQSVHNGIRKSNSFDLQMRHLAHILGPWALSSSAIYPLRMLPIGNAC